MSSLIYARGALQDNVDAFTAQRLQFRDGRSDSDDDIRAYWMLPGVRHDMIDVFVALDLQWDGDVLWAHSSGMDAETTIPTFRGMWLYMLRWRCFSKTRWAGIGPSARMVTMAEAGCVQALWRMAMDDPHVSSYHLGGYIRIGEREKDIIAVACFSAYIGEQFILDLFRGC